MEQMAQPTSYRICEKPKNPETDGYKNSLRLKNYKKEEENMKTETTRCFIKRDPFLFFS